LLKLILRTTEDIRISKRIGEKKEGREMGLEGNFQSFKRGSSRECGKNGKGVRGGGEGFWEAGLGPMLKLIREVGKEYNKHPHFRQPAKTQACLLNNQGGIILRVEGSLSTDLYLEGRETSKGGAGGIGRQKKKRREIGRYHIDTLAKLDRDVVTRQIRKLGGNPELVRTKVRMS